MRLLKLLLLTSLTTVGVNYCQLGKPARQAGFVTVIAPSGLNPAQVVVVGPDCSNPAGQRTRALIVQLTQARVPYTHVSTGLSFTASNDLQALYRLHQVMQGDEPIVFINRKAKANPQMQEVIAESRRIAQR